MFTISKEFHFSASHVLNGLEAGHPCGRLHGHNYVLIVYLRSEKTNNVGFVQDYNDLKPIKDYIDKELDHKHLNDVFPNMNPSVENMTKEIFQKFKPFFPLLIAIEMKETPKTLCRYEP